MSAELHFPGLVRSASEVSARGARLAGGLLRLGLREGDVLAVLTRNDPVVCDVVLACRTAGVYYCPINWHFTPEEARFIIEDSGAKALLVSADLLTPLAPCLSNALPLLVCNLPDDHTQMQVETASQRMQAYEPWLAKQPTYDGPVVAPRGHMAYTSGTTGRPKGVRRLAPAPDQVAAYGRVMDALVTQCFGVTEGSRVLVPAPLYHSAPAVITQQALRRGALLVIQPRFDPEETLRLIAAHRIDVVYMVPTMYVRLLKLPEAVRAKYDTSSLRFIASTGSPCPADVKRAMIAWLGPVVYETYAASETGLLTLMTSEDALRKPGSAGRPAGQAVIRIVSESGEACPTGVAGLVYMRQPAYTDFTYVGNDAARARIERDGLVTLGDMGYLDEDGYLFIVDRLSDMVISGGVNIYPAEIEQALIGCPGVLDCAVVGIPDAEMGEKLLAVVEPEAHATLTLTAIDAWLRPRLAGYKIPRELALGTLPRDPNGKIAKRKVRAAYWEGRTRRV